MSCNLITACRQPCKPPIQNRYVISWIDDVVGSRCSINPPTPTTTNKLQTNETFAYLASLHVLHLGNQFNNWRINSTKVS
jgi:hypothetical protein